VLQSYNWPGNVRQLRNVMEWLIIMAQVGANGEITADCPAAGADRFSNITVLRPELSD
jgi:DNA-binding NtrC family response regulator